MSLYLDENKKRKSLNIVMIGTILACAEFPTYSAKAETFTIFFTAHGSLALAAAHSLLYFIGNVSDLVFCFPGLFHLLPICTVDT
jgi:hypothetical protein